MDPSIIKILEDDEDETMHSGADVEAFTAALNRDIEGSTSSQPLGSDSVPSSQGGTHTSSQMYSQWQSSSQDEVMHDYGHQRKDESNSLQQHRQHTSEIEPKQHNSGADGQQQQAVQISRQYPQRPPGMQVTQTPSAIREQGRMQNPENNVNHSGLRRMNNQPVANTDQARQVPFGMLLPVITPQLDKDRAMKLHALYIKLKKNEIPKEGFVRLMKGLVGDQMLKIAINTIQNRVSTNDSQASGQQPTIRMPPSSATQGTEARSDSQGVQVSQMASSALNKTDREHSTTPIQGGFNNQQQQHLHFPQASFPTYGNSGGSFHHSMASLKQQGHDSQMRQAPVHQSMGPANIGGSTQAMNMMSARPNSVNDPIRVLGGSFSHLKNNPTSSSTYVKQEPADQANGQQQQHKSQSSMAQGLPTISGLKVEQGSSISGALMDEFTEKQSIRTNLSSSMPNQLDSNTSLDSRIPLSGISPAGANLKTSLPLKKPIIGQKKPIEGLGSSPPSSKKQKVSGGFLDQSIEQLNDVTAVSGVNLREEEEQLFSGPKEDSRASEASRRFVQEEEERLILQRAPLQKKLEGIMSKCGVKGLGKDVERCLSLCVEERIRGLISNLIRISKQRVDVEKSRHQTFITSDVRQQILMVNRRAREEWEKKQAEAEKIRKLSEPDDNTGADGDKEKDDGRGKALKVNKEEDDKMRTTAANVAARAAVGGDDMLSKWQLMAEQARQRREGTNDVPSSSQPSKESHKASSGSSKDAKDNQELEKRGHSSTLATSGGTRKFGRNQVNMPQTKVAHSISVKDVIAVLEREPQMSKSTLIYRLYDKMHTEPSTD